MDSIVTLGGRLSAQVSGRGAQVLLRGAIDERSSFAALLPLLSYPLRIDLGEVDRINSLGVRTWIDFITRVSRAGEVWLHRCPELLVHQFSYVTSTLGSARVSSVLAPYVCTVCEAIDYQEVVIDQDFDPLKPNRAPPAKRCTECTGPSQFNEVTDTYFLFLRS